jgi:hypothetical protein
MFHGGFSVLRCAHACGTQASNNAAASSTRNLARQFDPPTVIGAPKFVEG